MSETIQPGTLYVVSTPIGNLADITYRAVHILTSVQLIAAEDTRNTGILLKHYGIVTQMISYHQHNEAKRTPELVERLQAGDAVAIVSDAGTPGISDPAYRVVRGAIEAGIPVVAIPGASALLPAVVTSGLPTDRFVFEGFLPVKKGRHTRLQELKTEKRTMVFYEAPHRIPRTLRDLQEAFGDRTMTAAREITKKFEEVKRGTISEIAAYFNEKTIRGEFVLVVAGTDGETEPEVDEGSADESAADNL